MFDPKSFFVPESAIIYPQREEMCSYSHCLITEACSVLIFLTLNS